MTRGDPRTRLLAAPAAGAAALLASGGTALAGGPIFPPDAATNASGVDGLFWMATWMGTVAFAVVVILLAWCVLAFRARPGRKADYATGETRRARTFTGVFALAVFCVLDVSLAVKDHSVYGEMYGGMPEESEAEVVECLARQFEWRFRWPGADGRFGALASDPASTDDPGTVNVLRIPDDRPTLLRMRSIDVIHSFFLPNFRTKQDAVPGMTTVVVIRPRRAAEMKAAGLPVNGAGQVELDIACAELCGFGHYSMDKGRVLVLPREEYDAWLAGESAAVAAEAEEYGPRPLDEYWAVYDRRSAEDGRGTGGEGR